VELLVFAWKVEKKKKKIEEGFSAQPPRLISWQSAVGPCIDICSPNFWSLTHQEET